MSIICPRCKIDILNTENIILKGYLIYENIRENEFLPAFFEFEEDEYTCNHCGYKLSKEASMIDSLDIIYPKVSLVKNSTLSYRHKDCGNLTIDGIYSVVELSIIPAAKFYLKRNNLEKAWIESQDAIGRKYMADIIFESKDRYCNTCHEKVDDIKKPLSIKEYENINIIKYSEHI